MRYLLERRQAPHGPASDRQGHVAERRRGQGVAAAFLAAVILLAANPAAAARWTMDREASALAFAGTQFGSRFAGGFRSFDADIVFDPARPEAASIAVTVDTGSAFAGAAQRDEQIGGAEWFHTGVFPQARFVTRTVKPLGGDRYEVTGDLTIRDVTRPVAFPATIAIDGDRARARATVTLERTAWGVGQGQFADGKAVGIPVEVSFDIVATRTP